MANAISKPEPVKRKAVAPEGYTVVVSPAGAVTTVPDSILGELLKSGYTAK